MYPLFAELEGTLILGNAEQLHGSPLVGSKAGNLPGDITDELDMFVEGLKQKAKLLGEQKESTKAKIDNKKKLCSGTIT